MGFRIETGFDVYSDTPVGRDPDSHSPTLRRYHQLLWSKLLPDGRPLDLLVDHPKAYLHGKVGSDQLFLSSDAISHTYRFVKRMSLIVSHLEKNELDEFFNTCRTVGGYIIFPAQAIDKKITINGARGFHPRIGDRFDLTLECIRRHYIGMQSPLHEVLDRYGEFFKLFGDFQGYVNFFLLQDLVSADASSVNFYLDFNDFNAPPFPGSVDQYRLYKDRVIAFVTARNRRIEHWAESGCLYRP